MSKDQCDHPDWNLACVKNTQDDMSLGEILSLLANYLKKEDLEKESGYVASLSKYAARKKSKYPQEFRYWLRDHHFKTDPRLDPGPRMRKTNGKFNELSEKEKERLLRKWKSLSDDGKENKIEDNNDDIISESLRNLADIIDDDKTKYKIEKQLKLFN